MVNDDAAETVPLLEEELRVEKQSVATGKVHVHVTVVDTIEEIARAELDEEQVEVTRVHVGREVTTAPEVRTEGDVVIVPGAGRGARRRKAAGAQRGAADTGQERARADHVGH